MRNHPKTDHSIMLGQHRVNLWNEQTRTIEHHLIEVRVNPFELALRLGRKAIVSKARKSKSVHGAVVVTDLQKIS